MSTAHEDAARALFRDYMVSSDGAHALHVYYEGLVQKRWPPDYLDAIGQIHRCNPTAWPPEQVASFMMVHHMLMEGEVASVRIGEVEGPGPDRDRIGNQKKVDNLVGPFVARVDLDQGSSTFGDGTLSWSETIEVEKSLGLPHIDLATDHRGPVEVITHFPPGSVPLEIGVSKPSRTYQHLLHGKGVARWPYGSDRIWLFVRSKRAKAISR
jgi:hypothetical protein